MVRVWGEIGTTDGGGANWLVLWAAFLSLCIFSTVVFSCAGGVAKEKTTATDTEYCGGGGCAAGCGAACADPQSQCLTCCATCDPTLHGTLMQRQTTVKGQEMHSKQALQRNSMAFLPISPFVHEKKCN
ncbi:hypothetical protein DVH24_023549 [Malus domestica]|uniref:Uncharacterized protein n=1 Tax=Malus domestica TaxID=3750 RepID=A0A498I5B6_MALDO|nr:hypothetical protein DVH24_023549 [Malus domestica]